MKLNPFTLSFRNESRELEEPFREYFCRKSIFQIRIMLLIGFIMFAVFGLLDARIFPDYRKLLACIRYAVVCPSILIVFCMTFSSRFQRILQPVMAILALLAGAGIIVMATKAPQDYIFSYYAGIVIVMMFGYTLSKLRFIYASVSGWLILGLYEVTTLAAGTESFVIFCSNNFFFISVNLIGMLSCYSMEYYTRKDYYRTWLLKQEDSKVRLLNTELQTTVEKRTAELQKALSSQEDMADKVIESEKIAELSNLVAGIAHEINTPVGVGITATSFIEYRLREYMEKMADGAVSDGENQKLLNVVDEGVSLTLRNLLKAAELIRMFRLVAVNHSADRKVVIGLKHYLQEIVKGVERGIEEAVYLIEISCPEELEIKNCPDNFALVVTNIVRNAFQHGFNGRDKGVLKLSVYEDGEIVCIDFCDNGNGMDSDSMMKIFNPFYTTSRKEDHTGLGMYIVHSIVKRVFSGTISCESTPGIGTRISLRLPGILKSAA